MKVFKLLSLAILFLALGGCVVPKSATHKGINYLIDTSCLTKPVQAKNCDLSSPPKCKTVVFTMKPGCEQIDLGNSKR